MRFKTLIIFLLSLSIGLTILMACKKLDFTKKEVKPVSAWLHYDDGSNFSGIGITSGEDFLSFIKFNKLDLKSYNQSRISKVKFFLTEEGASSYYLEIYNDYGVYPQIIKLYEQYISYPVAGAWNTIYLDPEFTIDSDYDLWIGIYYYGHIQGTYPAGIDKGPAIQSYSDIYSSDYGKTWWTLSGDGNDFNWNIQAYVTNEKNQEAMLEKRPEPGQGMVFPGQQRSADKKSDPGRTCMKASD